MFDPRSRYAKLQTATHQAADGRQITYVRRRFLPKGREMPLLVEATLRAGERLDHVTNRTLGHPEAFWRVADANNAMNPTDLVGEVGDRLRIPVPQV